MRHSRLLCSFIFAIEWRIMNDVHRDLDFHFREKHFLVVHFLQKSAKKADVPRRFGSIRTACGVELLLWFTNATISVHEM